jgi:hypothetical protein
MTRRLFNFIRLSSPFSPGLRALTAAQVKDAGRPASRAHKHARTRELGREISSCDERGRARAEDMRLMVVRERAGRPRTPRCAAVSVGLALLFICLSAPSAEASFGLYGFDATFTNADGTSATQAGSHPFAITTSLGLNFTGAGPEAFTEGRLRDLFLEQIPGLLADTTAYPRCSTLAFSAQKPECRLDTQVGITANEVTEPGTWISSPVFNLTPPPGVLLRLGFKVVGQVVVLDVGLRQRPPYTPTALSRNTSERKYVYADKTQLWGHPSDPAHDPLRGECGENITNLPPGEVANYQFHSNPGISCPVARRTRPFLTLPTNCAGPEQTSYAADSWEDSGALLADGEPDLTDPRWVSGAVPTHDPEGNPVPFSGCGRLGFSPSITAQPTTKAASSPTGLDFSLDVKDEGLTSVKGLAQSDIKKAVVTLPEGMSVNPSQAEGLEVCSEAELEAETLDAAPGQGCPQAAKIGTVEVESPLVEEPIDGALYIATPYHNLAGDSLLAVYAVFKNPKLGIIVKQPLRVESDPQSGRLTTVAEEIPQLPFSHFRLHFREGTRSPLASPPTCGEHQVKAVLYPWSGGEPITTTSAFQIISGPDNGPCPAGGTPPFHPGLIAGSLSAAAGRFSPFNLRLSRTDSEQEITHFSIKLPPGVVGKLAGIPFCPDAAIEAAKARTGPLGGHEELEHPSCPAASEVGHTLVGAGVGPSLTYVPGNVYLAGPYHGAPISIVAITSGVAGPFDLGTVVVREALKVNPETAEVFIDATGSDPIPHIIKGIPVHLRDIRVYTDRPEFVLNPTGCQQTSTASTVLGAGTDFASAADDNPLTVTTPFQAVNCAKLPFQPKLSLTLKGSTKRAGNPALHAHLTMAGIGPAGAKEAGLAYSRVTLPKTLFLDNAHINTICTRVQFREGAVEGEKCPPGSVIGTAKALTPILSEPLEGPIYLRSSEHQLPDIAAALQGQEIHVVAVAHTDSGKGGGIRTTFESIPDAPISSVDIDLFGGKRGLIDNSQNLCSYQPRAKVILRGHNGKVQSSKPAIRATGCKHTKHKRHARRAAHR